MKNVNPTHTLAWKALEDHFAVMKDTEMKTLFSQDPSRFNTFSRTFSDQILVDFSKNRITQETLDKLQALAKECDVAGAINSMFSGEKSTVRKIVRYSTPHYATVAIHRLWSMAKM